MPRLPTMRVMGSQFISRTSVSSAVVMPLPLGTQRRPGQPWPAPVVVTRYCRSPGLLIAREKVAPPFPPLGLLVGRLGGEAAEGADHGAVEGARGRGHLRARGLVHERHELVREARHGAGDADPAHVGAAADPVDPAALGHVALDHRSPAAQLDQALGRAVLVREVALLVVTGPVAA